MPRDRKLALEVGEETLVVPWLSNSMSLTTFSIAHSTAGGYRIYCR